MKKVNFLQMLLVVAMLAAFMIPAAAADDYVTIDECCYLLGNVNNDERVSSEDARLALRFSVDLEELDEAAQKRADMTGDGKIQAEDARRILRLAVQLDPLPDHQLVTDAAVAATCTESGLTAGEHCSVCERVFVAQEVVPALGHTYETTEISRKLTASGVQVTACVNCDEEQTTAADAAYLTLVADAFNAWVAENSENAGNAAYDETEADFVVTVNTNAVEDENDLLALAYGVKEAAVKAAEFFVEKCDRIVYVKADGVTVFENEKFVNSGIKEVGLANALGFVKKMAALTAENNGIVELEIGADIGFGEEAFTFAIVVEGKYIDKIAELAARAADNISMTNDGDETTVTVKMPQKVINKAEAILKSKDLSIHQILTNDMTVKSLLTDLGLVDWTEHFSEKNLNRLNTVLAKIDGKAEVINNALDRIEVLKINGVDVLKDTQFKGLGTYETFLKQIKTRYITNEFGDLQIGDFIQEDGTLLLSVEVAVNTDSEKLPADGTVYEKINIVIDLGKDYTAHTEEMIPGYSATCDEPGLTDGVKCTVCNTILSKQEEIPALGHEPGADLYTNVIAATCTQEGSYDIVVNCARCAEELSSTGMRVPALGHDEIAHEGKAATCTEGGYEAYVTCSRCDYTTYKTIAALGHDWDDGVVQGDKTVYTCKNDSSHTYEEALPGKTLTANDFTVRDAEIHLGCKVYDPETEEALITCTAEDAVVTYLYGETAETAETEPDSFGIYHVYASVAAENGYDAAIIDLTELLEGAVLYLFDTDAIMTTLLLTEEEEEFNTILIACSDLNTPFILQDGFVVYFRGQNNSPYGENDFRYYLPGRNNENREVAEYVYGEDAFTYMLFRCTTAAEYLEQLELSDENGIVFEDSYDAMSNTITIKICGSGETKLSIALSGTGLKTALTNTELLKTCYVANEPDIVYDIASSIGTEAKELAFIDDLLILMGVTVNENTSLADCAAMNNKFCPIVFENETTWEGAAKLTYEVIKIQFEFVITD